MKLRFGELLCQLGKHNWEVEGAFSEEEWEDLWESPVTLECTRCNITKRFRQNKIRREKVNVDCGITRYENRMLYNICERILDNQRIIDSKLDKLLGVNP